MRKYIGIFASLIAFGCAAKSDKLPDAATAETSHLSKNEPKRDETYDLCLSLSNDSLMAELAADQIRDLCDGQDALLAELRNEGFRYMGKDAAKGRYFLPKEPEKGTTEISLNTSMLVPGTPKLFYQLLELGLKNPVMFADEGYEGDGDAKFESISATATRSTFTYKNDALTTAGTVEFEGQVRYITLKEGVAYAIVIDLTTAVAAPESLKIVIIIDRFDDSATEVLSMSNYRFANNGKHQTASTDLEIFFQRTHARIFRNTRLAFEKSNPDATSTDTDTATDTDTDSSTDTSTDSSTDTSTDTGTGTGT